MTPLEETKGDLEAWYVAEGIRTPQISIADGYLNLDDDCGFCDDELMGIGDIVRRRHGLIWDVIAVSAGGRCRVRITREGL